MKQYIRIEALNVEDVEVLYRITVSNGLASSFLEFYGEIQEFKSFGRKLSMFPENSEDIVKYELGDPKENWAYYLSIKVFCFEPTGHSAIEIKIDNKSKVPELIVTKFYLKSLPSAINRFGISLDSWDLYQNPIFEWTDEV